MPSDLVVGYSDVDMMDQIGIGSLVQGPRLDMKYDGSPRLWSIRFWPCMAELGGWTFSGWVSKYLKRSAVPVMAYPLCRMAFDGAVGNPWEGLNLHLCRTGFSKLAGDQSALEEVMVWYSGVSCVPGCLIV